MTTAEFWDKKFSPEDLGQAYGETPNDFLTEQLHRIKPGGSILSLGCGQGRNSVWLAQQGFSVVAVDLSSEGQRKAVALAESRGVGDKVTYVQADLGDYSTGDTFDAVVSIFCHLPPEIRGKVHSKILSWLKPGGVLILEHYTKEQLELVKSGEGKGGPPVPELMYASAELDADFSDKLKIEVSQEVRRQVNEGRLHSGNAAVVQFIARRET
eukprot:Hpha_TRINITY_DN31046_c0_g1::TRINITY_DN31046_c0_g1_i1::g.63976::m.63976